MPLQPIQRYAAVYYSRMAVYLNNVMTVGSRHRLTAASHQIRPSASEFHLCWQPSPPSADTPLPPFFKRWAGHRVVLQDHPCLEAGKVAVKGNKFRY